MNRRAFLGALGLAPVVAVGAAVAAPKAYAAGGVIRPMLPMKGYAMGECGPEAIIPLRRMTDGRLGVGAPSVSSLGITVDTSQFDAKLAEFAKAATHADQMRANVERYYRGSKAA